MLKTLSSILVICGLTLTAQSQIKNPGFEQVKTDSSAAISPWTVKMVDKFSYTLDSGIKQSGSFALRLHAANSKQGTWMPFSQLVPIKVERLKRVAIISNIKCVGVEGEVTLWCQILDDNDKMIGFENLASKGSRINGTTPWKKYSMPITLNARANKLRVGGYLSGNGTAWFDDFIIEDMVSVPADATPEVKAFVNEFTDIVKQNSIFKDSLNWTSIDNDIAELSKGLETVEEAKVVCNYVLQELKAAGDNHSFIQNKVVAQKYSKENLNPARPTSTLLKDNIAYVSVPGFSSTNVDASVKFATDIQNRIRELDEGQRIAGWIVDLRENTGGNMYPMIAGLGPLTGEGSLGYFVKSLNGKDQSSPWFYTNGRSGAGKGSNSIFKVDKPYSIKKADPKVAVLIGPKTGSSGEMTAISFIGKKNTRLFGQPSGGYTTGNGMFKLSDGSNLLLATTYTADRNLKKYISKIIPDQLTVQLIDGTDADIEVAKVWLLDGITIP